MNEAPNTSTVPATQVNGRRLRRRGATNVLLIVVIVIVLVVFWLVASFISMHNNMVAMRESVRSQWHQVDVVIQRRADLIPNLVATVKGFAAQEQKVIGEVTAARAALGGAQTRAQTISANNQLDGALSRLLVVVENYPQLTSNRNFLALQDELTGTENRISIERRKYNQALQTYNTYVSVFPNSIVAHMSGMNYDSDYFTTSNANRSAPPKVQF